MLAIQGWSQLQQVFKTRVTFTIMLSCRPRDWPKRQQSKKWEEGHWWGRHSGEGEEQSHSTGHLSKKFLTRLLLSYVFSVLEISVLWWWWQLSPQTADPDQQNVLSSRCCLGRDGGLQHAPPGGAPPTLILSSSPAEVTLIHWRSEEVFFEKNIYKYIDIYITIE